MSAVELSYWLWLLLSGTCAIITRGVKKNNGHTKHKQKLDADEVEKKSNQVEKKIPSKQAQERKEAEMK